MDNNKTIKITKDLKVRLLASIVKGEINLSEFPEFDVFSPTFVMNVIDPGIPLASSEDEIMD